MSQYGLSDFHGNNPLPPTYNEDDCWRNEDDLKRQIAEMKRDGHDSSYEEGLLRRQEACRPAVEQLQESLVPMAKTLSRGRDGDYSVELHGRFPYMYFSVISRSFGLDGLKYDIPLGAGMSAIESPESMVATVQGELDGLSQELQQQYQQEQRLYEEDPDYYRRRMERSDRPSLDDYSGMLNAVNQVRDDPRQTNRTPIASEVGDDPDAQTILECLNDCAEDMTRGRYDHNVTIDQPGHATIDATVGSRWGDSPVHIEVEWPTDPNADLRDKMGAVLEGLGNAYYHEMDDDNRGDVLLALGNTRDAIRDGDYVSRTFEEDWEDDYEPENEDPNSEEDDEDEEEDWEEEEDDWGDEDEDDWGDDDDDGFEDDFEPEPAASEKRGFFSRAADALSGLGQLKPEPAMNPFGGDPSVGCGNNSIGTGGMVRAHQMHYRDKDGNIRVTERKEHFRNAPRGKR